MTIKSKMIAGLALFIALILAEAISINLWINHAESFSSVINIAGRQRMLTQKMTKEALLTANKIESKSSYNATKQLFSNTLEMLINGDKNAGIPAPTTPELKTQLAQVNDLWRDFESELDKVANAFDDAKPERIARSSLNLLEETNKAVDLYEAQAAAAITALKIKGWVFIALSLLASGLAYAYIQRFLFSRLESMTSISEYIVQSSDLTKRMMFKGNDELSKTACAFDKMTDRFMLVNQELANAELAISEQLALLVNNANDNRASMDSQRNEIIHMAESISQMADTVDNVAHRTLDASSSAQKADEDANTGTGLLNESIQQTLKLAEDVNSASENIEQLSQASESIGGIADTISTIAEQTNLLALNAAIEAARAGEQGRGFAVVADEVRTLAQRTQDATSEIHKLIKMLQDTTSGSVEAMAISKTRSEASVAQAQELSTALGAITNSVQSLTEINHDIAAAAEEQTAVTKEVKQNIQTIEQMSTQSTENTNQTYQQAERLEKTLEGLRGILNRYKTT